MINKENNLKIGRYVKWQDDYDSYKGPASTADRTIAKNNRSIRSIRIAGCHSLLIHQPPWSNTDPSYHVDRNSRWTYWYSSLSHSVFSMTQFLYWCTSVFENFDPLYWFLTGKSKERLTMAFNSGMVSLVKHSVVPIQSMSCTNMRATEMNSSLV